MCNIEELQVQLNMQDRYWHYETKSYKKILSSRILILKNLVLCKCTINLIVHTSTMIIMQHISYHFILHYKSPNVKLGSPKGFLKIIWHRNVYIPQILHLWIWMSATYFYHQMYILHLSRLPQLVPWRWYGKVITSQLKHVKQRWLITQPPLKGVFICSSWGYFPIMLNFSSRIRGNIVNMNPHKPPYFEVINTSFL